MHVIFWVPYQVTDRIVRAVRPDADQSFHLQTAGGYPGLPALDGAAVWSWRGRFLGPWSALVAFLVSDALSSVWPRQWISGSAGVEPGSDVRRFFLSYGRAGKLRATARRRSRACPGSPSSPDAYTEWRRQESRAATEVIPSGLTRASESQIHVASRTGSTSHSLARDIEGICCQCRAATGTAAEGSMRIFIRIQTVRMASMMARLFDRDDALDTGR